MLTDFKCIINLFQIEDSNRLVLDKKILDENVFSSLNKFGFTRHLKSINNDIFALLKNLQMISLHIYNLNYVINNGIDWIRSINKGLNVDLHKNNHNGFREVYIFFENSSENPFTDVNYCIFKDFPHQQLVVPLILDFISNSSNCSCTVIWLIKYYYFYDFR